VSTNTAERSVNAAAVEQFLLDQVLDAARRQRPDRLLLQFLAQPGHGPIEVMQLQALRAGDVVILHPRRTVAVRARRLQSMQVATNAARSTGNSKARSSSKSVSTSATPSRSQILPNNIGPPIRLAATDSAPSTSSSSALISNTSSVSLAPEAYCVPGLPHRGGRNIRGSRFLYMTAIFACPSCIGLARS
jgi:hypothetical protein